MRSLKYTLLVACAAALGACAAATPPPGEPSAADAPEAAPAPGEALSPGLLAETDAAFRAQADPELRARYTAVAELAAAEGQRDVQIQALAQVARSFSLEGDLVAARVWLDLAATRATEDLPPSWARYLGVRGILEREEGDRATAQATFEEMYRFSLEHELYHQAVDAAHHVAIVAPPEGQIEWANRGIAAAEASGEEGWLGPLWNNLAWTYHEQGRLNEALDALIKAQGYHHSHGSANSALIADRFVGQLHRELGQLEEARALLVPGAEEARRRHDADPSEVNAENLGMALWELGELAAAEGQAPAVARGHLEEARVYLIQAGIADWWAEGLAELDARITSLGGGAGASE